MNILLENHNDDPEFLDLMYNFIDYYSRVIKESQLFIVQIDNWFDHKWFTFAGNKKQIYSEIGSHLILYGVSLWESSENVTIPPFSPNRVLSQKLFKVTENKFIEEKLPYLLHSKQKQRSSENLTNRISEHSDSGVFVWVSSNTLKNAQGSIMVYYHNSEGDGGLYASFLKKDRWKVNQTKHIRRDTIVNILDKCYQYV